MTDYFALLEEPRRPWLEEEELKQKFLSLSGEVHPDRVHSSPLDVRASAHDRYTELNAAYRCLREPKSRLLHLIELESGQKPAQLQSIPTELMFFFEEVGKLCGQADAIARQKTKETSPVLKVQYFEEALACTETLQNALQNIAVRTKALSDDLKNLNSDWSHAPSVGSEGRLAALPLKRLEEVYRALSFFGRWSQQLQNAVVRLID